MFKRSTLLFRILLLSTYSSALLFALFFFLSYVSKTENKLTRRPRSTSMKDRQNSKTQSDRTSSIDSETSPDSRISVQVCARVRVCVCVCRASFLTSSFLPGAPEISLWPVEPDTHLRWTAPREYYPHQHHRLAGPGMCARVSVCTCVHMRALKLWCVWAAHWAVFMCLNQGSKVETLTKKREHNCVISISPHSDWHTPKHAPTHRHTHLCDKWDAKNLLGSLTSFLTSSSIPIYTTHLFYIHLYFWTSSISQKSSMSTTSP